MRTKRIVKKHKRIKCNVNLIIMWAKFGNRFNTWGEAHQWISLNVKSYAAMRDIK